VASRFGTPVPTRTIEYGDSVIEVSGQIGDVCVTVDGEEKVRTSDGERDPFGTVEEAIDYAQRRIRSANRRSDPDRKVTQSPYLPTGWHVDFYAQLGWDNEKKRFTS